MIQPAPHTRISGISSRTRQRGALGALLLGLVLTGCTGRGVPETIPRKLGGTATPSAFVPPFAYEAYVRGELALARGQFAEAVAQFELATAAPSEDAYLLSRLAYAEALSGRPKDAHATLAHAERVDACAEALWLTRAELALRTPDLNQARDAYARASACAPDSDRGVLGLSRVLSQQGEHARALETLERFVATRPGAAEVGRAALELALSGDDGARVAHAADTWLAAAPPDLRAFERAVEWALAHDRPELSLRLLEHARGLARPDLECRIQRARGDREALRAVLARVDARALGGAAITAEYALYAGAYERAELEASALLLEKPNDQAYALRARARALSGRGHEALADLLAMRDEAARTQLARDLLTATGAPALAEELATLGAGDVPASAAKKTQ